MVITPELDGAERLTVWAGGTGGISAEVLRCLVAKIRCADRTGTAKCYHAQAGRQTDVA